MGDDDKKKKFGLKAHKQEILDPTEELEEALSASNENDYCRDELIEAIDLGKKLQEVIESLASTKSYKSYSEANDMQYRFTIMVVGLWKFFSDKKVELDREIVTKFAEYRPQEKSNEVTNNRIEVELADKIDKLAYFKNATTLLSGFKDSNEKQLEHYKDWFITDKQGVHRMS